MGRPHLTKRSWTPDDIARLKALAQAGASPARISAALNRSMISVQKLARKLGVRIRSVREFRAQIRQHGEANP